MVSHKYSVQYANEAVKIYMLLHTNKPTDQLPEQLQTNGESKTPCFKVLCQDLVRRTIDDL